MRIDSNFVAVVTGGSSGLGEATVRLLASLGARVVVADINQQLGEKIAKQINGVFFKVNVAEEENARQLFIYTKNTFGKVDAVINCAGILSLKYIINKNGELASTQQLQRVLGINTVGAFNVAKYAAKMMSEQPQVNEERGVIILVSSIGADEGASGHLYYSASKGAVQGMVLPMARSLAKHKIRVMCISPGFFETPFTSPISGPIKDIIVDQIPLGKMGNSQDYGKLCQTIIQNPYATGSIWRLDGGAIIPYMH